MSLKITMALALGILGAACARSSANRSAEGGVRPSRPDSIHVEALNENYFEARIHAVYAGGQRRSLGTIAGNGGRIVMALAWEPRALVFEVVFVTDGTAYVSHPVDAAPGQYIEVRVPQNIAASGFFRRVPRN